MKNQIAGGSLKSDKAPVRVVFGIAIFQFALTYIERISSDVVPLFINRFTDSAFLIYIVWSLNPLFNIINQPYVGWKGDRIWTRYGRRIPFILVGVPLTALFLILVPYSTGLPAPFFWAFAFIFWYQFFNDVAWGAYQPLYGEVIPPKQRGFVSGIQQIFGALSAFFCLAFGLGVLMSNKDKIPPLFKLLPDSIWEPLFNLPNVLPSFMTGFKGVFGLGAVLFVVCLIPLCLMVKEKKPAVIPEKSRFRLLGYYKEIFRSKQYVTLVALMIVLNLITTCIMSTNQLFARNALGLAASDAGFIIALDPLVVLLLAFPVGMLSDKIGRRKVIALSLIFTVITCSCALMATSSHWLVAIVLLWGIARTLQFVAFVPLIIDYIAPDRMGTFLGGTTQTRGIAVFLMGPLNGLIVDFFRVTVGMGGQAYRIPYAIGIICSIVAAILLFKLGKSKFVDSS